MVSKFGGLGAKLLGNMVSSKELSIFLPLAAGLGWAVAICLSIAISADAQPVSWPKKESPYAPKPLPSAPFGTPRSSDDIGEPSLDTPVPGSEPVEKSSRAPSSTFRLQAGITHSEALSPVPPAQRPGRVFRGVAVASPRPQRVKRFRVPDWMAGVWQRSDAREVSRIELPSGKKLSPVGTQVARVKDVFGSYRDANGQVWQIFNPMKATGQVDRGVSMDYHRVHGYDLVITGPRTVVVEVQATHTMVSKVNRRIAKVYQDEELNKYTLAPDGKLLTDSSVKVFDLEGKPFLLTRTTSSEIRVPPRNWPPRLNSAIPRN
ncbi:MAG: hypothetical protein K2Y39_27400 [Candidatus Obscuribacterales bacterium]|nr:hypothetical protein [Candidatus Obscuribacterales bacterium]